MCHYDWGLPKCSYKQEFHIKCVHINKSPLYVYIIPVYIIIHVHNITHDNTCTNFIMLYKIEFCLVKLSTDHDCGVKEGLRTECQIMIGLLDHEKSDIYHTNLYFRATGIYTIFNIFYSEL